MMPNNRIIKNIISIVSLCIYLSGCAWVKAAGRTYEGAGQGLDKAAEETEPGFSKKVFELGGDVSNAIGKFLVDVSDDETSTSEASETPEMKKQKEEDIVTNVQRRLIELGYNPGVIDGCMGHKTTNAIREYQKDKHMYPSGDITQELLDSLGI